ncbi:MAG: hypothetical protein ACREIA_06120 [Opitutaceae bacterium]
MSTAKLTGQIRIRQRTLSGLVRGYSIALFRPPRGGGLPSFLCGSEGEDSLLLFEAPGFEAKLVASTPGGFISTAPLVRDGRRYVAATTLFKPGFDGADATLQLYPLDDGKDPRPSLIGPMPFTHRVAHLHHGGRDHLLISTLCSGKADREDWSQPGGIHLAEAPDDLTQPWPVRPIATGLRKNHGMDFALLGRERRPGYLLSCMDGLLFLSIAEDFRGRWTTTVIDPGEHSDAFAFDWDGDGEPEIFSISPFHGHVLAMHKRTAEGWQRHVIHDDLAMGHIVWAGDFLGRPGLLAGSRRGRRELRLYRPANDGGIDPDYEVIDEEIGPTQIAVLPRGPRAVVLYVAAHGQDEVRLYEIEA